MTGAEWSPQLVGFLIALAVLSALWVFILVWFTASLVERPRTARRVPTGLADLREALLRLNAAQRPYRLVPASATEIRLEWSVVDASWYELFAKVKFSSMYRARLFLYERDHEVRCHESLRTSSFFIGFEGWVPKLNFNVTYQSGMLNVLWTGIAYGITRVFPPRIGRVYHFTLDTPMAKREIEEVAHANGWHFRGVPLSIEASAAGAALAERLVPSFMCDWSRLRFWGLAYAAVSAAIVLLFVAFMDWTADNCLVIGLIIVAVIAAHLFVITMWRGIEWLSRRRAARRARER